MILTIGLLRLESCKGCFQKIKEHFALFDLLDQFKFVEVEKGNEKIDVLFVEGGYDLENKNLCESAVKKAKKIVLFGSCALDPEGILSVKGFRSVKDFTKRELVLVGCPPTEIEVDRLMKSLIMEKDVFKISHPVCHECSETEIKCLLLEKKDCDGPSTIGGCKILCPGIGRSCDGCRTSLKGE